MQWLKKRLAAGAVQGVTSHIVATYILPLGLPLVTVVVTYFSGWPWAWIWLATLASVPTVFGGLLLFDIWKVRGQVEGKLILVDPKIEPGPSGGFSIGTVIHNNAAFPMEVELLDLRTEMKQTVPSGKWLSDKRMVLNAGNYGWFYGNPIQIAPKGETVTGKLEARLKYGRLGAGRRFEIVQKRQFTASFDAEGKCVGNVMWTEIEE